MERILVIEDDVAIADLISMNLQVAGYECLTIGDGLEALQEIESQSFDLALLDVMVPGMDGFELMSHMRKHGIPVIYVSARTGVADRIKGLRLGAEDYIIKPFDVLELLVRVEKVLARSHSTHGEYTVAGVTINEERHMAWREGGAVSLSPIEFTLVLTLMKHPNMVFTREQLLTEVWGDEYFGETRTVDVHIAELRRKLHWSNVIETVYRIGYRLRSGT